MAKPVLLTVDDDPEVLRAVERDLRRRYGGEYRVLRADGAAPALDALRQLRQRGEPVALLLVDQRMPRMNGVEFLEEATGIFPEAKRVLLTAYADTEAAIRAINRAHIDYYLLKPWDPPEENLYPILDDLLEDWKADFRPAFEGIRVVGHRWSPDTHAVKDFLARNAVPYRWMDVEETDEACALAGEGADVALPVVLFPDGTRMDKPSAQAIAEKVGLRVRAELPFYDLAIVGGGPAGLAAAVYGASEGLRTVIVEREAPGGQAGQSSRIENYLGFPVGLSGGDLARRAVAQARKFGVEILTPSEACGLRMDGPNLHLQMRDGAEISCRSLIVASGVSYRRLDVPGMHRLTGAGCYYGAAMTEAMSCRDQDVYVVGGGNSAGQAAMYFQRYAARVTLLVRGDGLSATMSHYLIEQIGRTPNIRVRAHTEVDEAHGDGHLDGLTLRDRRTGETERVPATAVFIFIGAEPRTEWLEGIVMRDRHGFIPTGPDLVRNGKRPRGWAPDRDPYLLEASVPGVFVAGDVRRGSVKRVASGVGEGAIAVSFVHQYLADL